MKTAPPPVTSTDAPSGMKPPVKKRALAGKGPQPVSFQAAAARRLQSLNQAKMQTGKKKALGR